MVAPILISNTVSKIPSSPTIEYVGFLVLSFTTKLISY
jgi:hypothetical protein